MIFIRNNKKNTNKFIIGLGAFFAGIGRLVGGRTGDGITGFGLAQIALGVLNMFRSKLKGR